MINRTPPVSWHVDIASMHDRAFEQAAPVNRLNHNFEGAPFAMDVQRHLDTGRTEEQIELVEAYCRAQGLFRTADRPDPKFTDVVGGKDVE